MMMTEMKPLKPLDHGNVLIVGTKASNFDEELRTHPRVIMWDSQNEHWTSKDVPNNVRAIFVTRWIGHAEFKNILAEARKKHITIFNPMGTGIIARQVKELLAPPAPFTVPVKGVQLTREPELKEIIVTTSKVSGRNKLAPLFEMIDFNRSIIDNARALKLKADAAAIPTTLGSLSQAIGVIYRKKGLTARKTIVPVKPSKKVENVDVSVQILDEMIKGLQDMRQFLVDTVNENMTLKAKMQNFKKLMEL